MTSMPWMKFYPTDWRSDPSLRVCSLAARGLWIEMIAVMHEATPYGHLVVAGRSPTDAQLAVLTGTTPDQISSLLGELESAAVFSRTSKGIVYSRRMTRDDKKARIARKNGVRGGNPSLCKEREISPSVNQIQTNPLNPQIPEARLQKIEKEDTPLTPQGGLDGDGVIPFPALGTTAVGSVTAPIADAQDSVSASAPVQPYLIDMPGNAGTVGTIQTPDIQREGRKPRKERKTAKWTKSALEPYVAEFIANYPPKASGPCTAFKWVPIGFAQVVNDDSSGMTPEGLLAALRRYKTEMHNTSWKYVCEPYNWFKYEKWREHTGVIHVSNFKPVNAGRSVQQVEAEAIGVYLGETPEETSDIVQQYLRQMENDPNRRGLI